MKTVRFLFVLMAISLVVRDLLALGGPGGYKGHTLADPATASSSGGTMEDGMQQPGIYSAGDTLVSTAAIDGFISQQMAAQRIPSMALAITRGPQVIYLKGYGTAANGRPMTPQTPFMIGSLSKSFTALAVMQLVEDGKIDLDRPVQTYLPNFTLADSATAARIIVRQLLNQTSGLADPGYPEMRLPQPATLEERVANMRTARAIDPPGRAYHYFDPNYGVLARLVEVVSGQPFSDYLQAHIFGPLEMRNTRNVHAPQEVAAPQEVVSQEVAAPQEVVSQEVAAQKGSASARGYLIAYGMPYPADELSGFLSGSGGVVSTAEDMAKSLILHNGAGKFGKATLLTPESMRLMHTPPQGIDSPYGMGWWEGEASGQRIVEHNGILSVYYAEAVLIPESGYGIVLLYDINSLPHAAFAFPPIKNGLVALLTGGQPAAGGFTVTHWGMVIAALTLAGVGLAVRSLFKLPEWRRRAYRTPVWRLLPGILWAFFPAALILGLPALITSTSGRAFSYIAIFRQMVDVMVWLGTVAVLGAINGVARMVYLVRRKQGPDPTLRRTSIVR